MTGWLARAFLGPFPWVKNSFRYFCGSSERLEKIGKLKGGYHG
jgi:hypothetical protein